MTPMRVDLPYLSAETDRHGNSRLYVRRGGKRVRLRTLPGSPEFVAAYAEAVEALSSGLKQRPEKAVEIAAPGTFGWLAASYFDSVEFRALDPISQRTRRGIIEYCLREPLKPGSTLLMAGVPLKSLGPAHIFVLRDRKAAKRGAANKRIKYVSAMISWAIRRGIMHSNPARDVPPLSYASEGFHTWTLDEVARFEERHPIGTKARLALALLLFTGARRGDMVTLGRQHNRDGWLRYVPRKTRHKRVTPVEIPVLPELEKILAASPCGNLTFLVTAQGKPFTAAGFGNWFRDRCNEAGLTGCSAHGLRKAGATIAANNGATDRQLMAIYNWSTSTQATTYTAAANRRKLAADAMPLLSHRQGGSPK